MRKKRKLGRIMYVLSFWEIDVPKNLERNIGLILDPVAACSTRDEGFHGGSRRHGRSHGGVVCLTQSSSRERPPWTETCSQSSGPACARTPNQLGCIHDSCSKECWRRQYTFTIRQTWAHVMFFLITFSPLDFMLCRSLQWKKACRI